MYLKMSEIITKDILFISMRIRSQELSPVVLSVIAAEMYFRGPLHRLIEYCSWMVLWCFGAKRMETLSVGIAQMQLRAWRELGYIDSYSPNFAHILAVLSVDNNYAACRCYLARFPSSEMDKSKELSKLYSGRARIFHAKVIEFAFNTAIKISLTKASSRRAKGARG